MEQRIPHRPFQEPVSITFWWNDRLDLDNHSYAEKLIVDGMKGWVIQDDDRRFVREIRHKFYDQGHITIEITEI